jgi:hypothetical protein
MGHELGASDHKVPFNDIQVPVKVVLVIPLPVKAVLALITIGTIL